MATKIQLRRGTAAQWAAADPILAEGEIGLELDTGKRKIGDGVRSWTALPYDLPTKADVGLGNVANVDQQNGSNITSGTVADARIDSAIARLASPTFTGTPVLPNAIIGEEVAAASGTSGTVTLNLNTARVFTLTPTGNVTTLTISNWPSGEAATVTLVVDQGATARTIATPSGGKFVGAATPTQANNKDCIFTYFSADGGTTIYCAASQEV